MAKFLRNLAGTVLLAAPLIMTTAALAAPEYGVDGQIIDRGKGRPTIAGQGVSICPPHGKGPPPCVMLGDRAAAEAVPADGKARVAGAIPFNVAGVMFPGTVYQNAAQLPGASGAIHLAQPKGNSAALMLHMTFKDLQPGKAYKVYIDTDGISLINPHSFGPWTQVGQFTTNAAGNGVYQYQVAPGSIPSGAHTWSVFVNRTDVAATVLISNNFSFMMP